jgi:hypothetical protein
MSASSSSVVASSALSFMRELNNVKPAIAASLASLYTISAASSSSSASLAMEIEREVSTEDETKKILDSMTKKKEDTADRKEVHESATEQGIISILQGIRKGASARDVEMREASWKQRLATLQAEVKFTDDDLVAIEKAVAQNETNKQWYRTDVPAMAVERILKLAPYQRPLPYAKATASAGNAHQKAVRDARAKLDTFSPDDLQEMTWEAGRDLPACMLGKECIGCSEVFAPLLPNYRGVVFMARLSRAELEDMRAGREVKTSEPRMCVFDEWRAFEEALVGINASADRLTVERDLYFHLYSVYTDADHNGFPQGRLCFPGNTWKGLCAPFPQLDRDAIRFVADESKGGRIRGDLRRMKIDPCQLEVEDRYPESSTVAASTSASTSSVSSASCSSSSSSSSSTDVTRDASNALRDF